MIISDSNYLFQNKFWNIVTSHDHDGDIDSTYSSISNAVTSTLQDSSLSKQVPGAIHTGQDFIKKEIDTKRKMNSFKGNMCYESTDESVNQTHRNNACVLFPQVIYSLF